MHSVMLLCSHLCHRRIISDELNITQEIYNYINFQTLLFLVLLNVSYIIISHTALYVHDRLT
jgi:hypothetical protein